MNTNDAIFLLAAGYQGGPYVSVAKIGTIAVLLVLWAFGVQWLDRDTDVVKTKREQWNLIAISGATVGCLVIFMVPWHGSMFGVGVAFWLIIAGGPLIAYVVHRNGRVSADRRVMTIGHLKRLIARDPNKARDTQGKGLRVRMSNHKGDFLEIPSDREEREDFEAVQDFFHELLWRRATDAEIMRGKEKCRLVYRIDGVSTERPDGLPVELGDQIFRYIKTIAGLDIKEIRRPQIGKIQAALLTHEGDVPYTEVRTSGTTAGERMRLHIAAGPKLMRLHEIGAPKKRMELIRKEVLGKSSGIFLMTSPPQNGLTTTQYAVIRSHDAYINNIHALERRSMLELDNITQQEFEGSNTDVDYARMLQTVLRRKPDIIMVGECEDRETAQVANRAALSHQKIYMGMQANDTFEALEKYMEFVGNNEAVGKALRGVLHQRLIRVLCDQCREAYEPDAATLKKLNIPASRAERLYRPPTEPKTNRRGREIICQNCQGTGYSGRTGIFEFLWVNEAVAALITAGAPINKIKAQCRKNKMYYLQEEGILKVIDGTTSMNEILRILKRSTGK